MNKLTKRERELMELVKLGKTNLQIAIMLGLSEQTVKNHLRSVFIKLNVHNRISALIALENGSALIDALVVKVEKETKRLHRAKELI